MNLDWIWYVLLSILVSDFSKIKYKIVLWNGVLLVNANDIAK